MTKQHKLGPHPDDKKRATVHLMYVSGMNCAQIGKEVGVSRQAIRVMLKRMGVTIRPRGG